jgi:uncharacterized protein (DUF2384 family)
MAHPASKIEFAAFLAGLQEGDELHISPDRFADRLDIEKQQLAELAHVHRNTVSRQPRSPQLQKFLRDSIRVLAAATDLNGSSKKAAFWFRNQPISEFGYKTPEALVSEGRAEDVLKYIDILDAGPAG